MHEDRRTFLKLLLAGTALPLVSSTQPARPAVRINDDELLYRTLDEISQALRRGEITAEHLLERQLARIDQLDGRLHSYITVMRDHALRDARQADADFRVGRIRSPLQGVPLSVKDLFNTRGVRTTAGLAQRADHVPTFDAHVITKLRRAGAVIVGKANLCEGAMSGYVRPFAIPVNPWLAERWPGGSSSGSAVALAAGLCFGSLGTDTGGSIRWPSAQNGTVGLKPTFGQVSRHGVWPLSSSFDHVGPMARSVLDVAHLYDAIAGQDAQDPSTRAARSSRTAETVRQSATLNGIRIGLDEDYALRGIEPAQIIAVRGVVDTLKSLGATIVPVRVPPMDTLAATYWPILWYEALRVHATLYPKTRDQYGTFFREFLDQARTITPTAYRLAQQQRVAFTRAFRTVLQSVDSLIAPGGRFGAPVAPDDFYNGLGTLGPMMANHAAKFTPPLRSIDPLALPMNLAGVPSVCLPTGLDDEGLPTGVQFVGDRYTDVVQLRIAYACERTMLWPKQHPTLRAS